MNKKEFHIASKVEESIKSLDGIKSLKAPDFFYTRLQARMEAEMLGKSTPFFYLGNLKLSMALLTLVLIMNCLSLFMMDFRGSSHESTDAINVISSEYFSPTDNYEYLNQ